jgi:DnaK suppressor protein
MGKKDSIVSAKMADPKSHAKAKMNGRLNGALNGRGKAVEGKAAAKKQSAHKPPPKRPKLPMSGMIVLPEGYRPSENEPFMNERHKVYFRNKLVAWKEEIVRQNRETLQVLHEDSAQHADLADRATSETDRALELRARDRQRKLIAKIDAALARIEEGTYGYCEETGEPIGLRRLDARPIATLSLEAQERHERREKVFRED